MPSSPSSFRQRQKIRDAYFQALLDPSSSKSWLIYHDLYLGGKALLERENMGFNLTMSDLCPSFVKDLTTKNVGLYVVDSHTGNHREDGFTPLETIRRFLGINRSRSLSGSKGRPSSQRGGYVIKPPSQM
ncbi:hypothetical protein Tco_1301551 [Tanacetum coccineum]